MKRLSALLAALFMLVSFACAEEAVQPVTLTATGCAPVEADVQTAVITFALSAEAETADATNAAMEASRAALMALLEAQGVQENDVRLTRYDMAHVYEYNHTKMSETKLIKGYKLDAGMQTRLSDVHQARTIVDALFASALKVDYQLAFEPASSAEAEAATLALAAQEALDNAQLLAKSAGLALGDLTCVKQTVEDGCALVEAVYTVK